MELVLHQSAYLAKSSIYSYAPCDQKFYALPAPPIKVQSRLFLNHERRVGLGRLGTNGRSIRPSTLRSHVSSQPPSTLRPPCVAQQNAPPLPRAVSTQVEAPPAFEERLLPAQPAERVEVGMGGGADGQEGWASEEVSISHQREEDVKWILNRVLNATLVGAACLAAAMRIFSVDHLWWTGWTVGEILRNVPGHNWMAYNATLERNPVIAKMCISGVVYTLGDYSAQMVEGRGALGFDRTRMLRSGLVGFCLHGSLSHYYYYFCEWLFPFHGVWVVPLKVAFDQTIWSGIWNSIYFVTLGLLRFEKPSAIASELKATFRPMLTAGWKLWPFAHIITYGVVPVEQRVLWVDAVELVWVTILSMITNEKAEARKEEEEPIIEVER